jgi:MerR family transcriptional regulator, light-induced transcriptional regulator
MSDSAIQSKQKEFLNFLIKGDHAMCSGLAKEIFSTYTLSDLYENIFKKSLYDIGEMWEYNKISVATEHLSSAIIEAILNEFYSNINSADKIDKSVIVACVENEFHQIGIKMISDIFEINGWNSYFLGANTPTSELIEFAKTIKTDMLAISLSIYFNLPKLEIMIQHIRKEFPALPILVGGQAFSHGGQNVMLRYDNVIYKPDLRSTDIFIKEINKNG